MISIHDGTLGMRGKGPVLGERRCRGYSSRMNPAIDRCLNGLGVTTEGDEVWLLR